MILLHTFPLLMVWPLELVWSFIDLTWWQAFLPVGLIPLGSVIVPIALHLSENKPEQWPWIFWLWGNDEEFVPDWWLERCRLIAIGKTSGWGGIKLWFRQIPELLQKRYPRFWWLAFRNPVNNFPGLLQIR